MTTEVGTTNPDFDDETIRQYSLIAKEFPTAVTMLLNANTSRDLKIILQILTKKTSEIGIDINKIIKMKNKKLMTSFSSNTTVKIVNEKLCFTNSDFTTKDVMVEDIIMYLIGFFVLLFNNADFERNSSSTSSVTIEEIQGGANNRKQSGGNYHDFLTEGTEVSIGGEPIYDDEGTEEFYTITEKTFKVISNESVHEESTNTTTNVKPQNGFNLKYTYLYNLKHPLHETRNKINVSGHNLFTKQQNDTDKSQKRQLNIILIVISIILLLVFFNPTTSDLLAKTAGANVIASNSEGTEKSEIWVDSAYNFFASVITNNEHISLSHFHKNTDFSLYPSPSSYENATALEYYMHLSADYGSRPFTSGFKILVAPFVVMTNRKMFYIGFVISAFTLLITNFFRFLNIGTKPKTSPAYELTVKKSSNDAKRDFSKLAVLFLVNMANNNPLFNGISLLASGLTIGQNVYSSAVKMAASPNAEDATNILQMVKGKDAHDYIKVSDDSSLLVEEYDILSPYTDIVYIPYSGEWKPIILDNNELEHYINLYRKKTINSDKQISADAKIAYSVLNPLLEKEFFAKPEKTENKQQSQNIFSVMQANLDKKKGGNQLRKTRRKPRSNRRRRASRNKK